MRTKLETGGPFVGNYFFYTGPGGDSEGCAKMASMALNPSLLGGELESALNLALQADKDVERERKEAELTVDAKHTAMEQWPSSYPPAADILAAVCVLSGLPGLGDKVRPTARRRSGLPEAEDEGTAAENAAPAGGNTNG